MTNKTTRVSLPLLLGFVAFFAVLMGSSGCSLFVVPDRTDAKTIRCEVDLLGTAPTDTDELSEEPVISRSVTSASPSFEAFYYLRTDTDDCGEGEGYESSDEIEEDWKQRLAEGIASETNDPSSVFRLASQWCYAAESLSCRETDEDVGYCRATTKTEGLALGVCPGSTGVTPTIPVESPGLRVVCGDDTCPEAGGAIPLEFGGVAIGDTRDRSVAVQNTGTTSFEVVFDGMVAPITSQYDFEVPIAENQCHPSNGDGNSLTLEPGAACSFVVRFAPAIAGEHRAEVELGWSVGLNPKVFRLEGLASP